MASVTLAAKFSEEDLRRMDRLMRERGFLNRSELIRDAVRLYLGLGTLDAENRLRMIRLINESIAPSRKTAAELIEEVRKEEDI